MQVLTMAPADGQKSVTSIYQVTEEQFKYEENKLLGQNPFVDF